MTLESLRKCFCVYPVLVALPRGSCPSTNMGMMLLPNTH
jgi:hypothetical protein